MLIIAVLPAEPHSLDTGRTTGKHYAFRCC